jgi:glutamate synthase domain-containing protein 2
MKLLDPVADESVTSLMTKEYAQNPLVLLTASQKLGLTAVIEAGIRAETGKELGRPLGSPIVLSPWQSVLLTPRQLFDLPTGSVAEIRTQTIIGPTAKKPLRLDIPIMVTAMSYGGSLSLEMKVALAKGAGMVGTATNTGESTVTEEERSLAKYLIGQYNRGGWLTDRRLLKRVDAIEVQLGQGAFGGAVESYMAAATVGEHLRTVWHLAEDQGATVRSRMPGVNSPRDIVHLVKAMKTEHDVPVGIKIAGSDNIEMDLEIVAEACADFVTIDGSEGGTAVAPPTLEDNLGLPTLYSLVRAVDWLEERGLKQRCSVIATGGLSTPGHFLKCLALGADAVSIGSIAIMAALHNQMGKVLPEATSLQMALYGGSHVDKLDVDEAARSVANFLKSCIAEMKLAAQAMGKRDLAELGRKDLVTVDKDLAEFIGIRYAGSRPTEAR